MKHEQKQHFSFNSRKGSGPFELFLKNLTVCGLTIVFEQLFLWMKNDR